MGIMPKRCPHPNKMAYASKGVAEAALLRLTPKPGQLYMPSVSYRCKCGKWHLCRSGPMARRP